MKANNYPVKVYDEHEVEIQTDPKQLEATNGRVYLTRVELEGMLQMLNIPERNRCHCGSGELKEAQYDGRGIFLCYTCDECHKEQMSKYRPDILAGYTQEDVDEPIEPED